MRIGLDLRSTANPDERQRLAIEADRLGLWAVLIGPSQEPGAEAGPEIIEAAALATGTGHIHLGVWFDANVEHPTTVAEETAVLDHLSHRRALAVVEGEPAAVEHVERLLAGAIVDGFALAPPPAQTRVPVLAAAQLERADLTGDLEQDRDTIDAYRDRGCTHLFVTWPGPLPILARHLVTRAATPNFPQLVADLADDIDQ